MSKFPKCCSVCFSRSWSHCRQTSLMCASCRQRTAYAERHGTGGSDGIHHTHVAHLGSPTVISGVVLADKKKTRRNQIGS